MSSFAAHKRNKSSFEKLTKAIEATSQPAEAGSKDDTRFWQPEVDKSGNGMAIIRFLPAPAADGDDAVISRQIHKMVSHLKDHSRVYWRLNPGRRDHASEKCQGSPFYPWSHRRLGEFAELFDFRQTNEQTESNSRSVRLYAEWHR
jgi:hypothetical protein